MTRVLFVSTQMEAAGVQGRAISMHRALVEEGHASEVVFLYRKRPVFDGIAGVTAVLPHRVRGPWDLVVMGWRLLKKIRDFRPDVIVGFAHYSSPIAAAAGWLNGVPRRIATQTSPRYSYGRFAAVLDWLCGTFGLYTANIAASENIRASYSTYPATYRSRLRTVHNGVHLPSSLLSKNEARARFGLDSEAYLLVTIGRLAASKNQRFLVEIVSRMPDVHLAILGEGEARADLESLIVQLGLSERVTLVGEIRPDGVADFLRCGDVFVFPSFYEAFGLVVVEAMLSGLPVITSDYPAIVEVVGDAGLALPLGDPTPWIAAIERLRSDPIATGSAQKRALERAQLFSFEMMMDGFREAWRHD